MDDKKLEYLKKAQERQRIKFLSPENIEKRKKKAEEAQKLLNKIQ